MRSSRFSFALCRCGIVTVLFLSALAPLAAAQTHTVQQSPSTRPPVSAKDLPNFDIVAPGIYRGGAPTEAGLRKLRAMGVHTVIDLRISPHQVRQEKSTAEKMGFTWINLPMGAEPPTRRQVTRFLATLQRAPAEPVFVHCQHGSDRTGCMIGIWRIRQQGWTFAEACKEMRHYGFNPHWKKLTEAVQKAGRQSERVTSR